MSGIPRSGSTVLAAILNQNKQTHVSATSGLVFALKGMADTWESTGLLKADDKNHEKLAKSMGAVIDTRDACFWLLFCSNYNTNILFTC